MEIGTVFANQENKRVLSIIWAGEDKKIADIYNEAKRTVKYLFKVLKNRDVSYISNENVANYYDTNLSKSIMLKEQTIGSLDVLKPQYTAKLAKKKVIVTAQIDFDQYVELTKENILAMEVSKYPMVTLDYTVILSKDAKYADLENVLTEFKSKLIKHYELVGTYENKYTIRYLLGSENKTLEAKDLQTFQDRFIAHIKDNNLDILV